jgi:hypothetical protein
LSIFRNPAGGNSGYADTDNNAADFATGAPAIRNSSTPGIGVSDTPAPPGVVSAGIGFGVTGISALLRRRKQAKSAKTAEATA